MTGTENEARMSYKPKIWKNTLMVK